MSASALDIGAGPGPHSARQTRTRKGTATKVIKLTLFYLVMTAIALVFMVPYVLTLFAAFKPISQIFSQPAWYPPHSLYLHNFAYVWSNAGFARYLANTFIVTAALTVGQVFFSILGAFAFARLSFPGRDLIFWLFLVTLMVPSAVTVIPLYTIMKEAHLLNTYWAIFLPYVFGTPYTIFLLRQFFRHIPQEMIDAARVDGASDTRVLFRIIVPLSRPAIITATLIALVFGWNNFLWPLIVTESQNHYVLTTGLANFQSNMNSQWNYALAGSVITLVPLAILFIVFQKHIIRSISITQIR
ncbi:MAG TPA: carbohydrate ABC transporter permease [Acidimicrobiales bacterium]|nr:carbohydrate ABC transporter permease [Acidimicrobiales bacterium]